MGTVMIGKSDSVEYSSPVGLVAPLIEEFSLDLDVCASASNSKLERYWTKDDDALSLDWVGNCWMNPPFGRDLGKWVRKACIDARLFGGTKVCLVPVRSNTKWWCEVCIESEIRFINGEVRFSGSVRGLWMPLCVMIFGEGAMVGSFGVIDYRGMIG